MKNSTPPVGIIAGKATPSARQLCEELAQQGISAIVKTKTETTLKDDHEHVQQLTGQSTQDMFFNGWKLLF